MLAIPKDPAGIRSMFGQVADEQGDDKTENGPLVPGALTYSPVSEFSAVDGTGEVNDTDRLGGGGMDVQ